MVQRLTIQDAAFDGLDIVLSQTKLAVLHVRGSQSFPCAQTFPAVLAEVHEVWTSWFKECNVIIYILLHMACDGHMQIFAIYFYA